MKNILNRSKFKKEKLANERKELESYNRKRKQVDEIAILDEIKKLKKLDLENLFAKKTKN